MTTHPEPEQGLHTPSGPRWQCPMQDLHLLWTLYQHVTSSSALTRVKAWSLLSICTLSSAKRTKGAVHTISALLTPSLSLSSIRSCPFCDVG